MLDDTSERLAACRWCEKNAVVVHLNFPMCGICFADASAQAHDNAGFDEWIGGLPAPVAEHVIRLMLRQRRALPA